MNPLDFTLYGFAALGGILILACYQDMKERGALKKAGTPRSYPSLVTQIQSTITSFIGSFAKKEPK